MFNVLPLFPFFADPYSLIILLSFPLPPFCFIFAGFSDILLLLLPSPLQFCILSDVLIPLPPDRVYNLPYSCLQGLFSCVLLFSPPLHLLFSSPVLFLWSFRFLLSSVLPSSSFLYLTLIILSSSPLLFASIFSTILLF